MTREINTYLDFEIHITARRDDHYPVHIRLGDGQDFAGELSADLIPWTPIGNPTTDGQHLFAALFADPNLRRAWDVASGQSLQRRIRLWLDADAPELHTLPWELFHDDQTFLAANTVTPLSRYLPSDKPWGGLVTERPIRVLVVISNPTDLDQYDLSNLDVATERALLTESLGDLAPTHFYLEYLEAPVTLEHLERALASGPHVLHFVGHGAFSHRQGQATLYLQDDAGNTQVVTETQMSEMFCRQTTLPSLILLAACQSAERSTVDAFAGLAPKLVQAGIPAVVAMQDKVAIAATRKLTSVFYEELARHGEVDRALNVARSLLLTGQSADAATPVLLMRLKDGKLWEPLWAKTNPYRGLAAFTEQDAKFFFGRQSLITELSDKTRRQRFIAVVGPSGSGKSSVVQAGLLPRLPKDWQVIKLRPGSDPYANGEWQVANSEWRMANGEKTADSLIPRDASGQARRFVLFIDQFEELFALCSPEVQTRFLGDLQALIASPAPITVILTLRADFFGYLQNSPLGKHLEHALMNVLPMEPADLRAAIARPAEAIGLRFEAGLVETIVEDARQARHTLPLLQFTLTQLWEQQTQGTLTYDAYVASGRVAGAIGLWAEDTYNDLTAKGQRLARQVFTRLVHYGEGEEADTRQHRKFDELVAQLAESEPVHRLVHRLADARLLVTAESAGKETVEIIHDALLREWGRLGGWISEQREFYLWRQRLNAQLQTWQAQGQDKGALLRGALLAEAERWSKEQPDELNEVEETYIQAGITVREHEQAEQKRAKQRITRIIMAAIALIVLTLAGFGWSQWDRAIREADLRQQADIFAANEAKARQDAEKQRDEAQRQTRFARAGPLVMRAQAILNEYPQSSLLLAIEAISPTLTLDKVWFPAAEMALRQAIQATGGLPLRGHEDYVNALAFSPDGRWLATGSWDNTVRLWSVADPQAEPVVLRGHLGPITTLAFSPDGRWLATGSWDDTTRLWSVADPQAAPVILRGHEDYVNALAFSPDGRWLATGGRDNTARLWSVADPQAAPVILRGHEGDVDVLAFSPDGRWLATGGWDTTARLWSVADLQAEPMILGEHNDALAFSPDGHWLATGSGDGNVRLWSLADPQEEPVVLHGLEDGVDVLAFSPDGHWLAMANGNDPGWRRDYTVLLRNVVDPQADPVVLRGHEGGVDVLAFSPDGRWLATGSNDKTARLWNVADPQAEPVVLRGHESWISALAFSPDGRWLATGSGDGNARLWNVADPQEEPVVLRGHIGRITTLAFSPDGHWLATGSWDDATRLWSVADPQAAPVILRGHEGGVGVLAFSPDGRWLATGGRDNTARLWSVADLQVAPVILRGHEETVTTLAFSPDGRWLATESGDGNTRLWSLADLQAEPVILGEHNYALAFSSDGHWLATGSWEETARLWSLADPQAEPVVLRGHEGGVDVLAFSPDGHWLATGSGNDSTVRLWNVVDPQAGSVALRGHVGPITALAFSPDGRWLATGSGNYPGWRWDSTARLWSVTDLQAEPVILRGHENWISALVFSPDGRWLATGSGDGNARLWDMAEPQAGPVVLRGYVDAITALAFSPDGHRLATRSWDGNARLWNMQLEALIDLACRTAGRNLNWEEWEQYMYWEPYRKTCGRWPVDPTATEEKVNQAIGLIASGDTLSASLAYQQASQWADEVDEAGLHNTLCRSGTLYGLVQPALPHCERAIELEPNNGDYHDSRGLARALTGDAAGASEDFKSAVGQWQEQNMCKSRNCEQREAWVAELEVGQSPFDEKTLKLLQEQ